MIKMKNVKNYLKKHYNYTGSMPVPCHVCGNKDVYAGHLMATTMGVQCGECRLKLGVEYEHYYVGEDYQEFDDCIKEYERRLLEIAIKLWNKEIKVSDLLVDSKVRCPWCGEWVSIETITKRKGLCNFCNKKMEIVDVEPGDEASKAKSKAVA